jgi:hypothetical protein
MLKGTFYPKSKYSDISVISKETITLMNHLQILNPTFVSLKYTRGDDSAKSDNESCLTNMNKVVFNAYRNEGTSIDHSL